MSDDFSTTVDPRSRAVVRDYELDDVVHARSPEQLKALADPLRKLICDVVLEGAMSVSELAELADRPKGTVAYHVDVLVDAGLLRVVRTRQVRAVEERFYGRVARTFVLHDDVDDIPFLTELLAEYDHDRVAALVQADRAGELDDAARHSLGTATYRRARIPVDRVAEYARRLEDLAIEFVDEPRDGDVEFGMYVTIFPTRRPTRRSVQGADDER